METDRLLGLARLAGQTAGADTVALATDALYEAVRDSRTGLARLRAELGVTRQQMQQRRARAREVRADPARLAAVESLAPDLAGLAAALPPQETHGQ